jgi:hypothetical protein
MELLLTRKPNNKDGIRMPVDLYESIKSEIILILEKEDGALLSAFFEVLHSRFVTRLGEDTGWYLYHVKLDLESRGLIEVDYSRQERHVSPIVKIVRSERRMQTVL